MSEGLLPQDAVTHLGSFQTYEAMYAGKIDVIITDPPYGRTAIGIYEALAAFARTTLRPGGWLLCLTGWGLNYEAQTLFRDAGLEYLTTVTYLVVGNQRARRHTSTGLRLWNQGAKPLLWFQQRGTKGKADHRRAGPTDIVGQAAHRKTDLCQDDNDPEGFHWQQSLSTFQQIVRNFTNAQDLICDPCMGSGTTLLASLSTGRRRVIGIEKDLQTYRKAMARLESLRQRVRQDWC